MGVSKRVYGLVVLLIFLALGCESRAQKEESPGAQPQVPREADEINESEVGEEAELEPAEGTANVAEPAEEDTAEGEVSPVAESEDLAQEPELSLGVVGEGPLNDATYKVFAAIAEDPPTEHLYGITEEFEGRHYICGDEYNVQLFYPHMKELGGAYVGVGADQGYLFIGWQRPKAAWLIDYDDWVIAIHKAYRVFFMEATTPEAFLALWSSEGEERAKSLLAEKLADDPQLDTITKLYERNRSTTSYRFDRLLRTFEKAEVPAFINDQEQYDYVRTMLEERRIKPVLVNLLDDEGLASIAAAAKALALPIRLLYLSNAEEYWNYTDQFRENIRALPTDEQSFVFRTLSTWTRNKDYQYNKQSLANYQDWLGRSWVIRVGYIAKRVATEQPDDVPFFEVTQTIDEAEESRRRRKERQKR